MPRSMVSLSFKTMNPFKEFTVNQKKDTFFASSIQSFFKVSKLELEDLLVLDTRISTQIGKTLQENHQFCHRLETLELRNIQFTTETWIGCRSTLRHHIEQFFSEVLFKT